MWRCLPTVVIFIKHPFHVFSGESELVNHSLSLKLLLAVSSKRMMKILKLRMIMALKIRRWFTYTWRSSSVEHALHISLFLEASNQNILREIVYMLVVKWVRLGYCVFVHSFNCSPFSSNGFFSFLLSIYLIDWWFGFHGLTCFTLFWWHEYWSYLDLQNYNQGRNMALYLHPQFVRVI